MSGNERSNFKAFMDILENSLVPVFWNTSQYRLFKGGCESGLHGRIVAKKPPLRETDKKKRTA